MLTAEVRQEIARKALHVLGCIWAVWGLYWPMLPVVGLSFFAVAYTVYEALRLRGRGIAVIERLGRSCRRQKEAGKPALGPVALAMGIVICFAVFDSRIACSAVLAACACDCAAGVVGRAWGRKGVRLLLCEAPSGPFRQKVPDPFSSPRLQRKTIEGTIAGLVAGFLACMPVAGFLGGAVAAVAASVVETLPLEELDNIVVPVAAACALALIVG